MFMHVLIRLDCITTRLFRWNARCVMERNHG
jgi:hypothetical protein